MRRGLELELPRGVPTEAVIKPLCIGLSTGLSEASWPDVMPDAPSLLVLVFVPSTSPFSSKVATVCCCGGALVWPVAA